MTPALAGTTKSSPRKVGRASKSKSDPQGEPLGLPRSLTAAIVPSSDKRE